GSLEEAHDLRLDRDVRGNRHGAAPRGLDVCYYARRGFMVLPVVHAHGITARRSQLCRSGTDAAATTGDDCDSRMRHGLEVASYHWAPGSGLWTLDSGRESLNAV